MKKVSPRLARLRHAHHYIQAAALCQQQYLSDGEGVTQGLTLFDRNRPNLDVACTWLQAQANSSDIDDLLIAYADVTAHIGELRYDLRRERIPQLEVALVAAQRGRRRADQGWLLGNLGIAYAALGEVRRAIEVFEQGLIVMREVGDQRGESNALGHLGNAYIVLDEVRRAMVCFEQQIVITRETGDRRRQGNALNNLGIAYTNLGEVRRAIDTYEQALTIACEMGDRRGEGQTLGNLGIAYSKLGEVWRTIDFYEQSLTIACEMGDRREESATLGGLGVAYEKLGDVRQAIDFYEQQLVITREIGDQYGEAIGNWNLGALFVKQGELARGVTFMQLCVDYERAIGHTDAEAHAVLIEKLRRLLQSAEQYTDLLQRAEATVIRALAEGSADERAALVERLTVTADTYASGDTAERTLAAQLRALRERLGRGDGEPG